MKNILVLGAGLVGKAIVNNLAQSHNVTVTDLSEESLQKVKNKTPQAATYKLSVSNYSELKPLVQKADLVVNATPGSIGYKTLEYIISQQKNVVDISFFPEDALALSNLAKECGVTAIVDCGVAPGIPNLVIGYYNSIESLDEVNFCVGGLPRKRIWPYQYKAPFSPSDVLEEYVRPARYVKDGQLVLAPALSEPELINFAEVGTLEAFLTDGVRSLIKTLPNIPNMKEKTLRYPGHIELMRVFRESGFFELKEIDLAGVRIKPRDLTAKLLFEQWKLNEDEPEFTILDIEMKTKQGKNIKYHLYDEYHQTTGFSSMARTTGYTACAFVELLLNNEIQIKGVLPPELVATKKSVFDFVLKYLEDREITISVI